MAISVAVVANAPLARTGLSQLVRESERLLLTRAAASLPALIRAGRDWDVDVLLVQPDGDGGDGGDLDWPRASASDDRSQSEIERVLAVGVPVVLLTDADLRERAWRARATVLPTSASEREIVAAVEAAAAGLVVLTANVAEQLARPALPIALGGAMDGLEPLTPREHAVLHLLADGLANRAIGTRLGISAHTAKFHVGQILAKLSAATRAEAVAIGWRNGLLTRDRVASAAGTHETASAGTRED